MSHFGWGVPLDWREESDNGTYLYYSAAGIMASASVSTLLECPDGRAAPSLGDWESRLGTVDTAVALQVPGSGGGWRYRLSGGTQGPATVLRAWLPNCQRELWITVYGAIGTADRIAATIVAQQDN
ncbi:hypothetical protein ACFVMC_20025 [Nocardia sp. NPDC127579]|uniref:hypothetical protein n=1 Tax=Nocardia sp. NPDC127579 TaxID=3345402 RepID=UPI00363FBB03